MTEQFDYGFEIVKERPTCACGCGELVKRGNRFINGHQSRGKKYGREFKIRKSQMIWQKKTEEALMVKNQ